MVIISVSLDWLIMFLVFPQGELGLGVHLGSAGPHHPGDSLERASVWQKEGEYFLHIFKDESSPCILMFMVVL